MTHTDHVIHYIYIYIHTKADAGVLGRPRGWEEGPAGVYSTIRYYTIRYYTIIYYDILYYTILYYTIQYYTILHYTIPYHTIL